MRLRARTSTALCAALVLASAAPPAVLADADPPSDILPTQDAYLPYTSGAGPSTSGRLDGLLAAARARGHPFKVAVIGSPTDLGGIPALYAKPHRYATFLAGEIRPFLAPKKASLLVVMPQGVALVGPEATTAGKAALARLHPSRGNQLADTAARAIRTVSAANGHPLPRVVSGGPSGGDTTGRWLLVGILLLALGGGGAAALRLRYRRVATETDRIAAG